jgi:polysaccharide biosynthesis protein PslG
MGMKIIYILVFIFLGVNQLPAQKSDVKVTTANTGNPNTIQFTGPVAAIPQPWGIQLKVNDTSPEILDQIRDLGYKVVRRGFIWESIEKTAGNYDFTAYDRLMNDCRDRGLTVIGCIAFANKLYGGSVLDDKGREGYANFAAALAKHFKDYNVLWEIWNEPNTMTFWGKHGGKGNTEQYANEYMALVKVTIPAMRSANPNCFIMAGSMSAFWDQSFNWMSFCFQKGILKSGIDAWSVHPYGTKNPEDYMDWYFKMREMMVKAGVHSTIPIVDSERGYPLGKAEGYAGGDPKQSKEYQAWHIVRQYLIDMLSDIKVTIWYEWSGKEGFGLVSDTEKTPAYNAAKFMMQQFKGYHLEKRLPASSDRDFIVQFNNNTGGVKLVAWTSPPTGGTPDKIVSHTVTIPVKAVGSLDLFQIYGEKGTVAVENGTISLTLTGAPQYITVNKPSAQISSIDTSKLIKVISPDYCSDVKANTTVKFKAPGSVSAIVKCWIQDAAMGHDSIFPALKLDNAGNGKFIFPADRFPHGPICIRISAGDDQCNLQLYNTGGVSWKEGIPAPPAQTAGMTMVFQDDFTGPLSISSTGLGATYRSRHSGGNFSTVPFADYESPKNPFFQRDTYLRIRGDVNKGSSGLISTRKSDTTYTCAVKFGYFECRFIAPLVTGSWPAFWGCTLRDKASGRNSDEIDVIEAYGNAPDSYEATWHIYGVSRTSKGERIPMTKAAGKANWAATSHIYGVLIKPDSITYYCDNIQVWKHPTTPSCKTSPLFVMINLAIGGGGWPYDLRRYNNIADMYVDYLRVFQDKTESE